jgi:hypothetical protein
MINNSNAAQTLFALTIPFRDEAVPVAFDTHAIKEPKGEWQKGMKRGTDTVQGFRSQSGHFAKTTQTGVLPSKPHLRPP